MALKRRLLSICLSLLLVVTTLFVPLTAQASYPLSNDRSITARSAIVVFLGTNAAQDMIMFEQNADERLAPAGLTRLVVGLYALQTLEDQGIDPDQATGTYTKAIDDALKAENVRDLYTVKMQEGDVWHVTDLLNIAMLQTAADAVTTLAVTLAGSPEAFVKGMNDMLPLIGCTDTAFTNIYGLDDPGQYTSARDMYRILRYASLNYSTLTSIISQSEYTVHPVVGEVDSWPTTNEMLRQSSTHYYTPLVYGRSGYTESIGQSCASVARDDGFEYMTVVMGSKAVAPPKAEGDEEEDEEEEEVELDSNPAFTDTMTLYRWAYNTFSYKTVVSRNQPITRADVRLAWSTDSVVLTAGTDLEGMLRNEADVNTLTYQIELTEEKLTAPVEQGQVCGVAKIYDGEYLVGQVNLCAAEFVGRSQLLAVFHGIWTILTSPVMLILLAVGAALFIGYIVIGTAHNASRRKNKRKRVKHHR